MKASTKPGPCVGFQEFISLLRALRMRKPTNASWTAPQKQVAVASSSVDHPPVARPDKGMRDVDTSLGVSFMGTEIKIRSLGVSELDGGRRLVGQIHRWATGYIYSENS